MVVTKSHKVPQVVCLLYEASSLVFPFAVTLSVGKLLVSSPIWHCGTHTCISFHMISCFVDAKVGIWPLVDDVEVAIVGASLHLLVLLLMLLLLMVVF